MGTHRRTFPPDPRISARLRVILEYHGVSAAEIARRIEVTPAAVSQWLHGITALSDANAQKIAEVLGEELDFLMCRKDSAKSGAGAAFAKLAAILGGERIRQLQRINPEKLTVLIDEALSTRKKNPRKSAKKAK